MVYYGACRMQKHGRGEKCIRIFGQKSCIKNIRIFGDTSRGGGGAKITLRWILKIGYEDVEFVNLAQDRVQWLCLVEGVVNLKD
jgi:hypothetical protein